MLLFGFGLALTVAPLTVTVMADAESGNSGIASGVNNAVARVAALAGIAAVGVAVAGRSGSDLDVAGYRLGMILTAALVATGGIVGLIGIRRPPGQTDISQTVDGQAGLIPGRASVEQDRNPATGGERFARRIRVR